MNAPTSYWGNRERRSTKAGWWGLSIILPIHPLRSCNRWTDKTSDPNSAAATCNTLKTDHKIHHKEKQQQQNLSRGGGGGTQMALYKSFYGTVCKLLLPHLTNEECKDWKKKINLKLGTILSVQL